MSSQLRTLWLRACLMGAIATGVIFNLLFATVTFSMSPEMAQSFQEIEAGHVLQSSDLEPEEVVALDEIMAAISPEVIAEVNAELEIIAPGPLATTPSPESVAVDAALEMTLDAEVEAAIEALESPPVDPPMAERETISPEEVALTSETLALEAAGLMPEPIISEAIVQNTADIDLQEDLYNLEVEAEHQDVSHSQDVYNSPELHGVGDSLPAHQSPAGEPVPGPTAEVVFDAEIEAAIAAVDASADSVALDAEGDVELTAVDAPADPAILDGEGEATLERLAPAAPSLQVQPVLDADVEAAIDALDPEQVQVASPRPSQRAQSILDADVEAAIDTVMAAPDPAAATEENHLRSQPTVQHPTVQTETDILILSPAPDSLVERKSTRITVQAPQDKDIEVKVNGQPLDLADLGQLQTDPATGHAQLTWYDIPLNSGTNQVEVYAPGHDTPLQTTTFFAGSRHKADVIENLRQAEAAAAAGDTAQAIRIINPIIGDLIDTPATSVTIQSPVGETIELRVNGHPVDAAQIGRTETNTEAQLMRQTWYGVTLGSGDNILAVYRPGDRDPVSQITVQVRGEPSQLRVQTLESRIPADGRSTATIHGQLLDANGNRSNWDAMVTLDVTAGELLGVDQNPDAPGFQVQADNGQFTATLQAGLQSGFVHIKARSNDLTGYHQLALSTPLRSSGLLTGVIDFRLGARGTDFFDSARDFLPLDQDNALTTDLDAAAFGITSVGEWLITGALNTDRALNTDCNGDVSLFRAVGNCSDTQYPVYGDQATAEVVTPSTDHLYLRFERNSPVQGAGTDYFLWGDYHTQELQQSSQLFTATGRDLHGFKAHYNWGDLQITGLYGNNVEGFQRDTIAPDGTSGFYFLSRRLLVPGSEEIYLELEELNRPGTVLQRQRLNRGTDYEIDYARGTLLFSEPVLRTRIAETGEILVRRIVSTYQFESDGDHTNVYGGRLQYNVSRSLEQATWFGTTYFREDRGDQQFELYGADAQISFGQDGRLVAEYAHSENGLDYGEQVSGDAYRVNVSGTLWRHLHASAHFQTTDAGFSNNATTTFVAGQTRYGAQLDAHLTEQTSLNVSYDHEDNFGVAPQPLDQLEELINPGQTPLAGQPVDNALTTIRAGVMQKLGKARLGVDWIHRDRNDALTQRTTRSHQLSTSLRLPINPDLSLHAYNDLTLSNDSDPLYPSRTTVGADWRIHPGITLSLNNSLFNGGQFNNHFLTSLGIKGEHTFATATTLRGELSTLGDYGLGGRLGLDQKIQLAPGLKMDLSYENVFSRTFRTSTGPQFPQPFAVGSGAAALNLTNGHSFSAGLSYTDHPDLKLGAQVEHRRSAQGSNTAISANALGHLTPHLTALFQFQQASAANQRLSDLGVSRTVKLGLAYRNIKDDTFNGFLRYEYRQNPATTPETLLVGRGTHSQEHLLAMEGIYTPQWNWELYGKFGLRHSRTQLAKDLVGTSTVSLAQLRATHRLNYRWDVAVEGRWVGQPSVGFNELGLNLEAGYYLNPNLRLSAGYAFGSVDDRDLGNSRSASGPYLGVTLKLDNHLFKDFGFQKPDVPTQQESAVRPASTVPPAEANLSIPEAQENTAAVSSSAPEAQEPASLDWVTLLDLAAVEVQPLGLRAVDLPKPNEVLQLAPQGLN